LTKVAPTTLEPFELELAGGAAERHYRRLRPEVERLPWGSVPLNQYPARVIRDGRRVWTLAAFQEHRTGAACAATLQALILSRAPLDLIAMATRFPLDELVHVELCARVATELGGAARLLHEPKTMITIPSFDLSPRLACAELVVRNFCVGEAVSIPILRASAKAAREPLIRAVLTRIVKDEAAHGRFGWMYLDAIGDWTPNERTHLRGAALDEIAKLEATWAANFRDRPADAGEPTLGWTEPATYLPIARRALVDAVQRPLAERGLYQPVA
jgi:hypothetical protein